jgi:hypothetical protein
LKWDHLFRPEKAEFAGGAFCPEVVGEMEVGAGAGGYSGVGSEAAEGEQAPGLVEAEAGAELARGGAEDAAAKGGVEGAESVEFDRDGGVSGGGADGAASATDGFSGQEELREDAAEFGLPAGLFFAGEFGEVGEGLVQIWVVGAELGEEFVADLIASKGGVGVGGVFAPGLVDGVQEGFDFRAAGAKEGAEDFAFWQGNDGVDGAEAFSPGAAEEFHEDGLGLVIEGVGGEDAVDVAGGEEVGEEVVPGIAGGFLDAFACGGDAFGDVGVVEVEGDAEADAEILDELLISVGFFAAEVVVDVDSGEAYAERVVFGGVGGVEGEEEGDGVCTTGDGDADTVAGLCVGAIEREAVRHSSYVSWSVMA